MSLIVNRFLPVVFFILYFSLPSFSSERVVFEGNYNRFEKSFIKADSKGDVWAAFYDMNGLIHAKNIKSGLDIIVNQGMEGGDSRGLAFDVNGENLYIAWRVKEAGKKVYFRAIRDAGKTISDPLLIDDNATEALANIKIKSNSKGRVIVIWKGEKIRGKDGKPLYHLYAICSEDFGKTFSEPVNLTLGYELPVHPYLIMDEGRVYFFSSSIRDGKRYLIFRKTLNGCNTWSEPVEIKEIGVGIDVEPMKVKNRLYVVWANSYYDDTHIMEGAYSEDEGKTWKTVVFEDTRGLDVGRMKATHAKTGHIYVVMSGRWEKRGRHNVYMLRSEDAGNTWSKLMPLRQYPFKNTTAEIPDIRATDSGEVVVSWIDYRNIRSNLYLQFSADYGKTWQMKDIPLEEPGKHNTRYYYYTDNIIKVGDTYFVLAYRFRDDRLKETHPLIIDFSPGKRGF